MQLTPDHVSQLRQQFPALSREVGGHQAIYFDGPGGTQVPQRVIDAISDYLSNRNANHGGRFLTSRENDAMLDAAQRALADFLGAANPDCVVFGTNMTSLTFAMSRALARTWQHGDEVVVTRLDHDANVTPWALAAQDAGAVVKYVDFHPGDCTLDLDDLRAKLTPRTRLVAVGCASNAVGTVNPVEEICACAHAVGALTFLDAVHFAPHALLDVEAIGCDFLVCSPYKFFGPHLGTLWGKQDLLERLVAYKLRAATNELPDKWTHGTLNHECIAGAIAGVDYLADLGRQLAGDDALTRRLALQAAYQAIGVYERGLLERLLDGLQQHDEITIWGIMERNRFNERLPTVSITHQRLPSSELAQRLGDAGIFVWDGNFYALGVTERLGLEPAGMVRIGLVHYNTENEVDRLLNVLSQL